MGHCNPRRTGDGGGDGEGIGKGKGGVAGEPGPSREDREQERARESRDHGGDLRPGVDPPPVPPRDVDRAETRSDGVDEFPRERDILDGKRGERTEHGEQENG